MSSIPVATKWLLDAVGPSGRAVIKSVFMVVCTKTNQKGTAFLLDTGYLITNEHVVRGCGAGDLLVISSAQQQIAVSDLVTDSARDLAALTVSTSMGEGLAIQEIDLDVGTQVTTWGYPLAYNGPAPLLTMGHLSGFIDAQVGSSPGSHVKHLVINAAFNPGNSGGPLLQAGNDTVIGVVVSKHAPITPFLKSAIEALAQNASGVVFTATDPQGNVQQFVESQVVAQVLTFFREMTQVVIGEAIAASELVAFLDENHIPWNGVA